MSPEPDDADDLAGTVAGTEADLEPDLAEQLVLAALEPLRAGASFRAAFDAAVAVGAVELPSPVWEVVGATDVDADVSASTPWLLRQVENRPPPDDMTAIWFGLHEVRGSGPGRVETFVAVNGGAGFPDPGWLEAHSWDPPGYAPTPGLRSLLPATVDADPGVRRAVRTGLVLAYGAGYAAAVIEAVGPAHLLAGRDQLEITTGFADGDVLLVGRLTPSGLDRAAQI
ncbi:MAG: hypothetical protein ACRD0N_04240 [Acidimicrobiales bacterium]